MRWILKPLLIASLLLAGACGEESDLVLDEESPSSLADAGTTSPQSNSPTDPSTTTATTAGSDATSSPATTGTATTEPPDPGFISETTFSEPWPFTVEDGTVRCFPGSAVVFVTGGEIHAVNGLARGRAENEGWLEVEPIWREDPDMPGTRINIGPVIDLGLSLCE